MFFILLFDCIGSKICALEEHIVAGVDFSVLIYVCCESCGFIQCGCTEICTLQEQIVTGIDLAEGMLGTLKRKHQDKNITLICASYFEEDFGIELFDAAVSVESLHHFTSAEKLPLYTKLYNSLKPGGYFILTDYFAKDDEYEEHFRNEYLRLKEEQGLNNKKFYHFDTPLTVDHETEALLKGGFNKVEVLSNWGATFTIKAIKA